MNLFNARYVAATILGSIGAPLAFYGLFAYEGASLTTGLILVLLGLRQAIKGAWLNQQRLRTVR